MNRKLSLIALCTAVSLGGCSTSGNTGVPPSQQQANLSANVLQFAVGTANIAGTLGLNTVVTYRQPNGLDGTLVNTPTITGPAGFTNTATAAQAGNDAGTNQISGSPQPQAGVAASPSTFGSAGGAFAYGFQPDNSTVGGGVSFARYSLPFYAPSAPPPPAAPFAVPWIGGPPAYPNVRDGTFPTGFQGYPLGFTDFRLNPVLGTYNLNVNVPSVTSAGTASSFNVSAIGTLSTLVPLPTFPNFVAGSFVTNGAGGGTINVTVPAGVTEAVIVLVDTTGSCYPTASGSGAPAYFTFRTTTVGPQAIPVPNTMGPTFGPQTVTRTICSGDTYRLYAAGFNYGAIEAGPPTNLSQTPAIAGSNGQADVTTTAVFTATYP